MDSWKKDLIDKAEYLLNYYKDGAPVFRIGSYEYRAMGDIIEALHLLPNKKALESEERE